jgi:hypothetical protein
LSTPRASSSWLQTRYQEEKPNSQQQFTSYDVDEEIRHYHKFKHDLHVAEDVVCYKDRIIIPAKLRPQVLETIHAAHQVVSGMISRVEDTVFWPGICTDIIKTRGGCLTCIQDAPSQPAGLPIAPPSPSFPFQYVVGDYFSIAGVNYLVLGDRFSGWLSIYTASKGEFDAKALVKKSRVQPRPQLCEGQAEDQEQEEHQESRRLTMMINFAQEGEVGA